MKTNTGLGDRVFRIVFGILLLLSIFVFDGGFWWVGLFGIVPLLTGIVGWCPAYAALGINTNPNGKTPQSA